MMTSNGGYIKLYRQILSWEWYNDINTKVLFLHLLLKANYKDLKFEGRDILRGQLVTSLPSLASQTGLSVRQIRVSLDKLKLTGEVTSSSYARYRIITVVKYDDYQVDDRLDDSLMTDSMTAKGQADDRLVTGSRQADDRLMTASKEYKEYKEREEEKEPKKERETAKRFSPPTREEIHSFCKENGLSIDIDRFLNYYESNGWKVGRAPMKSWQATVRNWAAGDKQSGKSSGFTGKKVNAQQYDQRNYGDKDEEVMQRLLHTFREE